MGIRDFHVILLFGYCFIMMFNFSFASVVLEGVNVTLSFEDIESNFGPTVEEENGICGTMYIAEPLDACSSLTNKIEKSKKRTCTSPFALIIRGGCSFEDKVRRAQSAGFEAAVVYDSVDDGPLIAMAGNSAGIKIPAVFVSKASGEKLKSYAGLDIELWVLPTYENSAWSIMVISFVSLLAMSAVLATCFFVRRYRIRRGRSHAQVREFHGMSSRLVKAMPSLIFTVVTEDNCTSSTCAICLEDYSVGDKLRILPCRHKFHAFCVDAWLTSWRTFCPVCKRDARTTSGGPPALESTPLLSSNPSSAVAIPQSSFGSFRSSSMHSSAIQIASPNPHSHVGARDHSVSSSPQIRQPLCSSHHHLCSPSMHVSRSSLDLRNMSQISNTSQFVSPHSLGYLSPSRLNTRYTSLYYASPNTASSSYTRDPNSLHYSDSTRRLSPHTSMKSLLRSSTGW